MLAETVVPWHQKNFFTGRIEVVDKDELSVPGIYRVQAYTGGYTRDFEIFKDVETGLGANICAYAIPPALHAVYGQHPYGITVYLRLRLK